MRTGDLVAAVRRGHVLREATAWSSTGRSRPIPRRARARAQPRRALARATISKRTLIQSAPF
jgi:hypothetical protein